MSWLSAHRRSLALVAVLVLLVGLFVYTSFRAGPLATVQVVVAEVAPHAIRPALFGTGNVEARSTYRIGPTAAGRLLRVEVEVGQQVKAGQLLGEIEPVDLDDRIKAQGAAVQRAEAAEAVAAAQLREVQARKAHAEAEVRRYEGLWAEGAISDEGIAAKRQERQLASASHATASAGLSVTRGEAARLRAEHQGLRRQRANLKLLAPVDGLISSRDAEPGSTVVAGQAVVSLIDPARLWLNVRFDQARSAALRRGLPARIVLRSRERVLTGRIAYVEPVADAVTEETLAKVIFDAPPQPRPAVGELAEVTATLDALPTALVVPNAAVHRVDGQLGVWVLERGALRFAPVSLGVGDLEGRVQVLSGLQAGERVVTHSLSPLNRRSRVDVVGQLPGVAR